MPHSTHDHHDTPLTEANAVLAAPDESHVEHAETGLKAAAIPVAVGLIIGVIFVTVFLAAFHAPRPHDLPVAVIAETTADAGAAAGVQRALDGMAAGEFRVIGLPSRAAAETALQHREVFGVWLPGQATLLVAGANGPSVTGALTGPFTRLAGAATGARELSMVDTLPVSPNDTAGLSTFYAGFGVVLAGFLFAQISYAAGPVLPLRRRLTAAGVFAVLSGVIVALVAGSTGFGALPGNLAALALVITLMAAAVAGAAMTIIRLLGPAGTMPSAVLLLILGNASGGGTLPPAFLPAWLEPLAHVLPVGVGLRALRGHSYFHNDGLVTGVLVLVAWILVALVILTVADRSRQRRNLARAVVS